MEWSDEGNELWEHQGMELTVAALRAALGDVKDGSVRVRVAVYTGDSVLSILAPVEIGLGNVDSAGAPELLITAADIEQKR